MAPQVGAAGIEDYGKGLGRGAKHNLAVVLRVLIVAQRHLWHGGKSLEMVRQLSIDGDARGNQRVDPLDIRGKSLGEPYLAAASALSGAHQPFG